jgi:hypothetical protein
VDALGSMMVANVAHQQQHSIEPETVLPSSSRVKITEVATAAKPIGSRTPASRVSYLRKVFDMVKKVGVAFCPKGYGGDSVVAGCVMQA